MMRPGVIMLFIAVLVGAIAGNPVGLACQLTGGGFGRAQWAQWAPGIPYSPSCP